MQEKGERGQRKKQVGIWMIELFYYVVAVGMPVSRHPPHRSQRAELPHWAPTSGCDVKPLVWIWVYGFVGGYPRLDQSLEPFPRQFTGFMATAPQGTKPSPNNLSSKRIRTASVSGHPKVVEMSLYHRPYPFPLFRDWVVPMFQEHYPHLFDFCPQTFCDGLTYNGETLLLWCPPADMGEPQEVKRLWLALASFRPV